MTQKFSQWMVRLSLKASNKEEVPPRKFELFLELPAIRPRSKLWMSKKDLKPPTVFWKDLNSHPIELLRNINAYLKQLNTSRISENLRSDWVEQSLLYACPAIRKIYSEEYKVDALPESHDRREGLIAAINACGQLATGFKRKLLHDYNLPDSKFSKVRPKFRLCALRVVELIRMEQRLRSLRYQKLPEAAWRDCNRIFFAIAQCEDVSENHQALACIQIQLDSKVRELGRIQAKMISIKHVYLSIQLYGIVDTNSIFSRNLHLIDVYVSNVIDSLDIWPDDGSPLTDGEIIIYSNQRSVPFFERQSDNFSATASTIAEKVLALRVGLAPLESLLKKEHKRLITLFESEQNESKKAVTNQEDLSRLSMVDIMFDRLRLKRRKEAREIIVGSNILYVHNGFMSVYKFLVEASHIYDEVKEELDDGNELRDALAGHSAIIASGLNASDYGQWHVLDKSEGGVHIKTQESQFTTAMFIGQILTFSYSREKLQTPALGFVSRLSRDNEGEIDVTIQNLSKSPAATAIQSDFLSKNDMAFPAILLPSSYSEKTQRIVLHHSHHLSPGTPIQVERGNNKFECAIADILQTQREFIVYGLNFVSV